MNSFEFNKIFAAILTAGLVAMLGGFVSGLIVHPKIPAEDAVPIEGLEGSAGGGAAGPTGPQPVMALIAAADVTKGEKLSKACAACHSFDQGGPNKVGPNLYGVLGGKLAHIGGFEYSAALKEKGGSWDYDAINHFLYKPKDFIKGTKMSYAGMKKPEDRAAIIAWLRTQGSTLALPTDAQIAAEAAALAPPPAEVPAEGAAAVPADGAAAPASAVAGEAPKEAAPADAAATPAPAEKAPAGEAAH